MAGRSFALLSALLLAGCAGGGSKESAPETPSLLTAGGQVGAIEIRLDDALNADQREVIAQYQAIEHLETELKLALEKRSAWSPEGELRVDVTLDHFRLRTNNANVWLGSMAGADSLSVIVSVAQQGQPLKTFDTNTSSIQGGLMMPGRTVRLQRLIVELAKRIADGI
jgi:hypothetical protein